MINKQLAKEYCRDDISKIENYDEAIADTTQTWICHHILGEILSKQQLLDHDFYYSIPSCLLKFVTLAEHNTLHKKGKKGKKRKPFSEEHRRKMSEAKKGKKRKPFSEEHHRKMREAWVRRKAAKKTL